MLSDLMVPLAYLGNGQRVVQVAERIELPLLPFNGDEKLFDSFQSQLVTLDEDPDRVRHEL